MVLRLRFTIGALAVVLTLWGAAAGGSDTSIGYFFMSGRFDGEREMSYSKDDLEERVLSDSLRSYITDVHGPYPTKFQARRAMREQKRDAGGNIYFTRIFKL